MIINADDWGRTREDTDAAFVCHQRGRITSATAMVFMEDSKRAAALARASNIDMGLHLNLTEPFSAPVRDNALLRSHSRIRYFLTGRKYAFLIYNQALRKDFEYVFESQHNEFVRLYGSEPSHIDGHHHLHLCSNILFGNVIPQGQKVRRNFFFWPGEKSFANRAFRALTDSVLAQRYRSTDYFFALSQCGDWNRMTRVAVLAKSSAVELMTHPANEQECQRLLSSSFLEQINHLQLGTYSAL